MNDDLTIFADRKKRSVDQVVLPKRDVWYIFIPCQGLRRTGSDRNLPG